jgi:hypothetical protein
VILRWRDTGSIVVISGQRRDGQCLIALPLVDAKKPDSRGRKQLRESHLNVRTHMTRELPRGRDQPVLRDAREMPTQRFEGKLKLFVFALARGLVIAGVADDCAQGKRIAGCKRSANFASGMLRIGRRDRLGRDQKGMT